VKVLLDALLGLKVGQRLVVGSGNGSDLALKETGVDTRHACFSLQDGSLFVQDLDSSTGTFINGREIRGLARVQPQDRIRLGEFEFAIPGDTTAFGTESLSPHSQTITGDLSLTVIDAVKTIPGGRRILDRVSFHLEAGQFLGILGASGSGKSTLIKSLAGLVDLSEGAVLIQGATTASSTLRTDRRVAYLPQDVVIHEALTASVALGYIARLKNIASTDEERREIVRAVLDRVGLSGRIDVPIHRLSGGQRKRVALAAELLGDPKLILLDEATSGLDPATEGEMMELFRSLTAEGRTVVCITHFPGRLHLCDRLLYLNEGKGTFYGSPDELRRFFGVKTIEDVYTKQSERTAEDWESQFQKSVVGQREAGRIPVTTGVTAAFQSQATTDSHEFRLRQTRDLTSRYFRLQLSDPRNLLLLLSQAPVIALMIATTYGTIRFSFAELHAANTKEVIFLLVVSVLWCSGTSSVREIVKEIPIVQHEARFGVGLVAYLMSKFVLLGLLSMVQVLMLLLMVRYFTQMSGLFDLQFLILMFTGLVGVTLGLAISSVSGTSERAMTVLPVVLLGQAIFSGGLARLEGIVRFTAMLFSPAYWSLDGLRSLFSSDLRNATYPGAPGHFQPPILGPGGPLFGDLMALTVQGFVLLAFTWVILTYTTGQMSISREVGRIRRVLALLFQRRLNVSNRQSSDLADS
jgi:ABC-type multidrug transport system ATPase subunit